MGTLLDQTFIIAERVSQFPKAMPSHLASTHTAVEERNVEQIWSLRKGRKYPDEPARTDSRGLAFWHVGHHPTQFCFFAQVPK